MSDQGQKVAIITGGSQGIGASLVAAYRRQGWGVVATARTMKPTDDPEVLTVDGDIAVPATADRIVGAALERFGRIDTLVNNAGVFVSKPFTDYTAEDYALVVGVNLSGFFWLTQRAIAEMLKRYGGHVVNISTTLVDYANSSTPAVLTALTKGGLAAATRSLAVEYASRACTPITGTRPSIRFANIAARMAVALQSLEKEAFTTQMHAYYIILAGASHGQYCQQNVSRFFKPDPIDFVDSALSADHQFGVGC